MKLRIRSIESTETLKIQAPSPSSLQDLKDAIAQKFSSPPETLHLSLNRKDELHCSSLQESLQSLGITSGDLIFYTLNPNGFSEQTLTRAPPTQSNPPIQASNLSHEEEKNLKSREIVESHSHMSCKETSTTIASNPHQEETLGFREVIDEHLIDSEGMGIDKSVTIRKTCSVPRFLKKVFKDEVEGDRKILIIAVHAVMLESGFVAFDPATGKKIDGFRLPDGWASTAFTVSFWYTLPDLVKSDREMVESVVLIFQNLGKFVTVYGSLSGKGKGSVPYRVCLNETRFVPSINFLWTNCEFDSTDALNGKDGSSHERGVFEFWKIVKDRLALPLLVDLCEKTGLAPPACFMLLPTELKHKILEFLPCVDIAKVGCVCSELKYLSSNDDLWKAKFVEEFGKECDVERVYGGGNWKERFAGNWVQRKRMTNLREGFLTREGFPFTSFFPLRSDPNPFEVHRMIIGGDHDRFPTLRVPAPFGVGRIPRFPVRPPCHLGEFNF